MDGTVTAALIAAGSTVIVAVVGQWANIRTSGVTGRAVETTRRSIARRRRRRRRLCVRLLALDRVIRPVYVPYMRKSVNGRIRLRTPMMLVVSLSLAAFFMAIPTAASAQLCQALAQGSWAQNCTEQYGDAGPMVTGIQAAVSGWAYNYSNGACPTVNIDGTFGTTTRTAVRCYQSHHSGLTVDGIVGPQTWASLQGLLKKQSTDGNWVYYDVFHHPTYPWFRQWAPSGIWYVEDNCAYCGNYEQMTWS
jgi:hypothetical protein